MWYAIRRSSTEKSTPSTDTNFFRLSKYDLNHWCAMPRNYRVFFNISWSIVSNALEKSITNIERTLYVFIVSSGVWTLLENFIVRHRPSPWIPKICQPPIDPHPPVSWNPPSKFTESLALHWTRITLWYNICDKILGNSLCLKDVLTIVEIISVNKKLSCLLILVQKTWCLALIYFQNYL